MTTPLHPRSDWTDPKYPVTGPSCDLNKVEYITLHWPGGKVSPGPGLWNPHETVVDLQSEQMNYVHSRGYSIGYNFCVDYIGHRWILRGYDIRCAANGGAGSNTKGLAIQLKLDEHTSPTNAMIQGTRDMIAEIRGRLGRNLPINGHRDVRPEPTSCPGAIIYRMIQDGTFESPGTLPPIIPPPVSTPKKGVQEMAVAIQSSDGTAEQQFATFSLIPGCQIGWLTSDTQISVGLITGTLVLDSNGKALKNFGCVEIQDMIDRYWAGGPKPPGWH